MNPTHPFDRRDILAAYKKRIDKLEREIDKLEAVLRERPTVEQVERTRALYEAALARNTILRRKVDELGERS